MIVWYYRLRLLGRLLADWLADLLRKNPSHG